MVLATSGPRRVPHRVGSRNVGDVERVLSVMGGSALAAAALRRRGMGGAALGALAAELIRRGATGRCRLYERLGVSTADGAPRRLAHDLAGAAATVDARQSVKVEESVTIDAPRTQLYAFWRDVENHPRFMSRVSRVELLADGRTRYEMTVPGGRVTWESEIVKDYPGELISWKTVGDSDVAHAGSVHFRDTTDHLGTLVTLVMDYEPPGGRAGYALSKLLGVAPEQMIRADLRRLKALVEAR